jgi:hypothetical protein
MPSADMSGSAERHSRAAAASSQKPRNADDVDVDDQVTVPSRHLYAEGFVYDPAIATKERYRLAEILRCRGDVERQPQLSGIDLCSKVETERRIVQRLSSKFKELGLRCGGDAIFLAVHILFGQAGTLQQGHRVNMLLSKRGNRPSRGESGRRWQQAGAPSFGSSPLLPLPLLPLPLLPLPLLLSPLSLSPLLPYPHLHAPSAKPDVVNWRLGSKVRR